MYPIMCQTDDYKTSIQPVLTYASQMWSLTNSVCFRNKGTLWNNLAQSVKEKGGKEGITMKFNKIHL